MARVSGRRITIIVLVIGLGLGALASWFMVGARPRPGAFIDAVAAPGGALAIRQEKTSNRSFAELWRPDGDRLVRVWSGLAPPYAGRPGTITAAATRTIATVRVVRGGRPQLFAFDMDRGAKLASFELDASLPSSREVWSLPEVGTVGQGDHAIEVLGSADGGAVVIAADLPGRSLVWRRTLPWRPTRVWIAGTAVGAADGQRQVGFELATGEPTDPPPAPPAGTLGAGLTYDPARRELRAAGGATFTVPADAVEPRPYHVGDGVVWIVRPGGLQALSTTDLTPQASS